MPKVLRNTLLSARDLIATAGPFLPSVLPADRPAHGSPAHRSPAAGDQTPTPN